MSSWILHVDLDAFFASVEMLDHPEYRGKPVIVGGLPDQRRSVVSTCSYEARKFGVHSAMPTAQAYHLCPHGIFLEGNYKRYQEKSYEVMSVFKDFSPDVMQMSVDEAFIDLTGTERLFGPVEKTAEKIKNLVKEKTGLTVSMGLATNHYIAKIASGLNKPDGFTIVEEGKEMEFMHSLPLEKLWGAGGKTLEKLRKNGIYSIKDIYNRSPELLSRTFGDATGLFLYKAARGMENDVFTTETKSHSVSAETTFEYDLYSQDAIEKAILELVQTVHFRLLKEHLVSRTPFIKIRYEDFQTVSIQETSERNIASLEDFYERIKRLFFKKYDRQRGIRLLGIGAQNTESDSLPQMKDLFDFGDEKKRKVEQAVLQATKKTHIEIKKARLFSNPAKIPAIIAALLPAIFLSVVKPSPLCAKETVVTSEGAGALIFDTTKSPFRPLEDSSLKNIFNAEFGKTQSNTVDFLAGGHWKASITTGINSTFGGKSDTQFSWIKPVFKQEVDLNLYLLLNKKYYFEAAFAEEFEKNTVAAGYIGEGFLKEARISNRKIIFPEFYSVSKMGYGLGGGDAQTPGIMAAFSNEKLKINAAVRWEQLLSKTKTWRGKNALNENTINLVSWNKGQQFYLPGNNFASSIRSVYIESSSGDYSDIDSRKYKKLSPSDYLVSSMEDGGVLTVSQSEKAVTISGKLLCVAVSFYGSISQSELENHIDSLQAYFGDAYNLKDFSFTKVHGFFRKINGENCVLLQWETGFSPYAVTYRYDIGTTALSDAAVISSTSRVQNKKYAVAESSDDFLMSGEFFDKKHNYIDVYIPDTSSRRKMTAEVQFPFASDFPLVYLAPETARKTSDLVIKTESYSTSSRFDIGNKAVEGTVRVYKNGVLDGGAKYSRESGTFSLSSAVSDTDKITATWYEDNESASTGSVAAGAGILYKFNDTTEGDFSVTTRWGINPESKFATASNSTTGFAAAALGISKIFKNAKLSNTFAASIEDENTTGTFRVLGFDDKYTKTSYLEQNADGEHSGVRDSEISGYAIPLNWNFGDTLPTEKLSVSKKITVNGVKGILSCASLFSMAFKAEIDKGLSGTENLNQDLILLIGETELKTNFDFSKEGWQTVTVTISDEVRSKMPYSLDKITVIIRSKDSLKSTGTIKAGPYHAGEVSFATKQNSATTIRQNQIPDGALSNSDVSKLNKGTNIVQNFEWITDTDQHTLSSSENFDLTFSRYFSGASFSNYEEISFFFKSVKNGAVPNSTAAQISDKGFEFTLDCPDKDNYFTDDSSSFDRALYFSIKPETFNAFENGKYHKVTVDLVSKKIKIDGTALPSSSYTLTVRKEIEPVRLKITINAADSSASKYYTSGEFSIDELYFDNSRLCYVFSDKLEYNFKKDGTLLGSEENPVVSNLNFSASATGSATKYTTNNDNAASLNTQSSFSTDIPYFKLLVDSNFTLSDTNRSTQDKYLYDGKHSIASNKNLFGFLSIEDTFTFSKNDQVSEKVNSVKTDFSSFKVPLKAGFESLSKNSLYSAVQERKSFIVVSAEHLNVSLDAGTQQNVKDKFLSSKNYFSSYASTTAFIFNDGKENASRRKVFANSKISVPLKSFRPSVQFSTYELYTSSTENARTHETTKALSFPWRTKNNVDFEISWKSVSSIKKTVEKGGNYSEDTKETFDSFGANKWIFYSLPFFDITGFSIRELSEKNNEQLLNYSGHYAFSAKRPFYGTRNDFFIPSSITFDFHRDILRSTTKSDNYVSKLTVNFTSMNIFGRKGIVGLFKLFESDEYNSSFSIAVKTPRDDAEATKLIFSGYISSTLFINSTDNLRNAADFSFQNKTNWNVRATVSWRRDSKWSLIGAVTEFFSKNFSQKSKKLTRTDSLNFSLSSVSSENSISSTDSDVTKKLALSYVHTTDMKIAAYFSIFTSISTDYTCTFGKANSLSATITLGGELKF